MANAKVKEIEKEIKELFYKDRELPPPYSVSVPMGDGIETGKPRPPSDDQA